MRILSIFALFASILLCSNPLAAQTISNGFKGAPYECGLKTTPPDFVAPGGTISFRQFVGNLGDYLDVHKPMWRRYDPQTNVYTPAPTVAFMVQSQFFKVEFGSIDHAQQGSVLFSIGVEDCYDLVLHTKGGIDLPLAYVSAHLQFSDEATVKPAYADIVLTQARPFLELIAGGDHRILVIARLVSVSRRGQGSGTEEHLQYVQLGFEIEEFHPVNLKDKDD